MHKMMRHVKRLVPAILLVCFASPALAVKPVTNVTAATGGNAIPNSNIASGTWVTLTGPSMAETANNGISTGTLVLNAPTGFQFNPASAVSATVSRVSGTKTSDLTLSSGTATVTATTITITVTASSAGQIQNRITWSGIQVMPTGCIFPTPNPGNITITGTSITNGTNLSTPNAGALTETGSTALTFVQHPTSAFANAIIAPAVTINACGNGTVLPTVTVALTTPAGATLGGTLSVATNNLTGLATFSDLSVDLANDYTLTATSPGLTSAESNLFTILNPNPGGFNAFENSTAAGSIAGNIFTKLAGTAFTLDVIVLNLAKNAVMTTFTGDVKVELLDTSNNTGALDANNCRNTWAVIQTLAPNLTFVAGDNGRKAGASFTENNARKEARIRVTYPAAGAPTAIGCSTDVFSIRPAAFSSITSNMNADATGTSTSAAPTLNAGGNFTLTATAIAGYDGTPVIDSTKVQAHAGAAATGTAGGVFTAAVPATGIASGSSFTYSEVGYVRFNVDGIYDNLFTAVDQPNDCTNDFSNALAGGKYGCLFGNTAMTDFFGRFIPDHFTLLGGSTLTAACVAGGFTYMGQNMGTSFSIEARNLSDIKTQNYNGGFARLDGATAAKWTNFGINDSLGLWGIASLPAPYAACNAIFGTAAPYDTTYSAASPTCPTSPASPIAQSPVALRISVATPTGTWINGTGSFAASVNFGRASVADGPYTLSLGIAPMDADGAALSAVALNLDADNAGGNERVLLAAMQERYGRLKLSNAHGSELLNLPVPLLAQYWNGTGFVTNSADSCTQVLVPSVANTDLTKNPAGLGTNATMNAVAAPGLGVFVSGDGKLSFSRPNTKGYVDITIADTPAYLQYDWDTATAGLEPPSSRATFGVYKGSDEFIYMRENY